MKLFFIILFLITGLSSLAQTPKDGNRNCVSKAEMDSLFCRIYRKAPTANGMEPNDTLTLNGTTAYTHAFMWPLSASTNYYQPSFYYISNYLDLASTYSIVRDYHCGDRSYDSRDDDGNIYNHTGIDIATGPFGWKMMDDNNVNVIAAEGGRIVDKHIGEASRTCRPDGVANTYYGNYIAIKHDDSTSAFYMHMKGGTVTSKNIGARVNMGEYLGVVGSSGNSSDPHLHFEVRSPSGGIMDPFQNGNCRNNYAGLITSSLWAQEEPYHNKKILSVFTLSGNWTGSTCDTGGISSGSSEVVPYKNHFSEGNLIYFSAAVRDINDGNTVRLRIFKPNGTEISDYTYTMPSSDTFRAMKLIPLQVLIAPGDLGTYRLLCTYNSASEVHLFTIGCPGALTLSGARSSNTGAISGSTITSTETLSSLTINVEYQAETEVIFTPGFIANAGSEFLGRINNCTIGGQRNLSLDTKPMKPDLKN